VDPDRNAWPSGGADLRDSSGDDGSAAARYTAENGCAYNKTWMPMGDDTTPSTCSNVNEHVHIRIVVG